MSKNNQPEESVIYVIVDKDNKVISKAAIASRLDIEKWNSHFKTRNPYLIIEKDDIKKYPVDLFSEIKLPKIKSDEN